MITLIQSQLSNYSYMILFVSLIQFSLSICHGVRYLNILFSPQEFLSYCDKWIIFSNSVSFSNSSLRQYYSLSLQLLIFCVKLVKHLCNLESLVLSFWDIVYDYLSVNRTTIIECLLGIQFVYFVSFWESYSKYLTLTYHGHWQIRVDTGNKVLRSHSVSLFYL